MAVIGLNNNIDRNGVVYHIQTEDSGTQNPHLFTHLFVDGVIIATKRISYEHLLKREDLQRCVQTLMRWQHRQMYQELMNGVYDTPSIDTAARETVTSTGEFLAVQNIATASVNEEAPESFQFGARYMSAKPLVEVVLGFLNARALGGTAAK
jgi:hypothetical protein